MLWVHERTVLMRRFFRASLTNVKHDVYDNIYILPPFVLFLKAFERFLQTILSQNIGYVYSKEPSLLSTHNNVKCDGYDNIFILPPFDLFM